MKFFNKEVNSFLIVGFVNTVLTYLIYLSILTFFTCEVSYSISFVLGVILSYTLNTQFVFKESFKFSTFLLFPLVYVVQYMLGIALLNILVKIVGIQEMFAPLGVIVLSMPVTFFLTRFILK